MGGNGLQAFPARHPVCGDGKPLEVPMRSSTILLALLLSLPVLAANPEGYPLHLTFDDGPNPATTPQVLAILARHEIKATFFVCGSRLASQAGQRLLEAIVAGGHQVANHTWDHPWLTRLGDAAIRKQIADTRAVIGDRENGFLFLRPPGGFHDTRVDALVAAAGYRLAMWDIDTNDWRFNSWRRKGDPRGAPANFLAYVGRETAAAMKSSRLREGSVVLMHDIHAYTANRLEALVQNWEKQGCRFVDHLGFWPRYRP